MNWNIILYVLMAGLVVRIAYGVFKAVSNANDNPEGDISVDDEFDATPSQPPGTRRMDLGNDPLDPHGDGTIREGDPMFDVFMSMLSKDSSGVIANRNEDGTWDVEEVRDER